MAQDISQNIKKRKQPFLIDDDEEEENGLSHNINDDSSPQVNAEENKKKRKLEDGEIDDDDFEQSKEETKGESKKVVQKEEGEETQKKSKEAEEEEEEEEEATDADEVDIESEEYESQDLDEDDLEVIKESFPKYKPFLSEEQKKARKEERQLELQRKQEQKRVRFKRLKKRGSEASKPETTKDKIAKDIFDELEDDLLNELGDSASPKEPTPQPPLNDEDSFSSDTESDELDDFVINEDGVSVAKLERRKRRQQRQRLLEGDDFGLLSGPTRKELSDNIAIFGGPSDNEEEEKPLPVRSEKTEDLSTSEPYRAIYEPEIIKEKYMTKKDESIRGADFPERFQNGNMDFLRSAEEIYNEALFIQQKFKGEIKVLLEETIIQKEQIETKTIPIDKTIQQIEKQNSDKLSKKEEIEKDKCKEELSKCENQIKKCKNQIKKIENYKVCIEDFESIHQFAQQLNTDHNDIPYFFWFRPEYYNPNFEIDHFWDFYHWDQLYKKQKQKIALLQDLVAENHFEEHPVFKQVTIDNTDETALRDIFDFLKYLIDSQQENAAIENENDSVDVAMKTFDLQEGLGEGTPSGLPLKKQPQKRPLQGRGVPLQAKFFARCHRGKLLDAVNRISLSPEDLIENVTHNDANHCICTYPPEPPQSFYNTLLSEEFPTVHAVKRALRSLRAAEYAAHPKIRGLARSLFGTLATASVTLTARGKREISNVFHDFFQVAHISRMPLLHLFEEPKLCLLLQQAMKEELLTLRIGLSEDSSEDFYQRILPLSFHKDPDEMELDGDLSTADASVIGKWNLERQKIIKEAFECHLLPALDLEYHQRIVNRAVETVSKEAAASLEKILQHGSYNLDRPRHVLKPRIASIVYGVDAKTPSICTITDENGEYVDHVKLNWITTINISKPPNFSEPIYSPQNFPSITLDKVDKVFSQIHISSSKKDRESETQAAKNGVDQKFDNFGNIITQAAKNGVDQKCEEYGNGCDVETQAANKEYNFEGNLIETQAAKNGVDQKCDEFGNIDVETQAANKEYNFEGNLIETQAANKEYNFEGNLIETQAAKNGVDQKCDEFGNIIKCDVETQAANKEYNFEGNLINCDDETQEAKNKVDANPENSANRILGNGETQEAKNEDSKPENSAYDAGPTIQDRLMERRPVDYQRYSSDLQLLKHFLRKYMPFVVVVGANCLDAVDLFKTVHEVIAEINENLGGELKEKMELIWGPSRVCDVIATSSSMLQEFPPSRHYPSYFHQSLALARYTLDPVAAVCSICTYPSASAIEDILKLRLHPLQIYLGEGNLIQSLRHIEQVLINTVNERGVDLNGCIKYRWQESQLQFVSGLGKRKARHLLSTLRRRGGFVYKREVLQEYLPPTVYRSCIGFLDIKEHYFSGRYSSKLTVLDDLRIHPDDYNLAQFLAKSISQSGQKQQPKKKKKKEPSPEHLIQTFVEGGDDTGRLLDSYNVLPFITEANDQIERKSQGLSHFNIGSKIKSIFVQFRYPHHISTPFKIMDESDRFHHLSGETDESLYPDMLVHVKLNQRRIKENNATGTLPSGVTCHVRFNTRDDKVLIAPECDSLAYNMRKQLEVLYEANEAKAQMLDDNNAKAQMLHFRPGEISDAKAKMLHFLRDNFSDLPPERLYIATKLIETGYHGIEHKEDFKPRDYANFHMEQVIRHCFPNFCIARIEEIKKEKISVNANALPANFSIEAERLSYFETINPNWYDFSPARKAFDTTHLSVASKAGETHVLKRVAVDHHRFMNITAADALSRLADEPVGEVIFRPSATATNALTLHWKFWKDIVLSLRILESQKSAPNVLGQRLTIITRINTKGEEVDVQGEEVDVQGVETFEELDEICGRYIEPINNLVSELQLYPKFVDMKGQDEVENFLREKFSKNKNQIHYCLSFSHKHPGYVLLSYLPGSKCIREYVLLSPDGFVFRQKTHHRIDDLITWFKNNWRQPFKKKNQQQHHQQNQSQQQHQSTFYPHHPQSYQTHQNSEQYIHSYGYSRY